MCESHFARIGERPACLFLEVGGSTIPELGNIQAGIEYRWCIDRSLLPVMTNLVPGIIIINVSVSITNYDFIETFRVV